MKKLPEKILAKAIDGKRIEQEEALILLEKGDLLELGLTANRVRQKIHKNETITFVVDRNINYTNVCEAACKFCAFYRPFNHPEAYTLSKKDIFQKIEETIVLGGTQILMQGGLHPALDLDYFVELFTAIKERYDIHLHCLSPVEIFYLSQKSNLSLEEVIQKLVEAGLDSIPGGGAEILVDDVRRQISPGKVSAGKWLEIMEIAHNHGLKTTATMMFGSIETLEQRIAHLEAIRNLQDKTGGFTAFIPWSFQPGNTSLGGREKSAWEYLKMLAVARLYLDNIPNIQVSWVTQGPKVAQIALSFGANDFGSTMLEENVVRAAGAAFRMTKDEIIKVIKDAGKTPAQRNTSYQILRRY